MKTVEIDVTAYGGSMAVLIWFRTDNEIWGSHQTNRF